MFSAMSSSTLLGEFALAEGKQGGLFYTSRSIVELLVTMLEPYKGRVCQPRKLGLELSGAALSSDKRVFVSTQFFTYRFC
jgi:hypothetical protein